MTLGGGSSTKVDLRPNATLTRPSPTGAHASRAQPRHHPTAPTQPIPAGARPRATVPDMNVLIAGGHGKIALLLAGVLAERGDTARGLIRNPDHAADLEAAGGEAVVLDLEQESAEALAAVVEGSDAVVFAAGAGPGSGAERKRTVDYEGAVKLIQACEQAGVDRYLIVSAMGVDRESYPESMRPYYEAKRDADEALRCFVARLHDRAPGRTHRRPGHRPRRGREPARGRRPRRAARGRRRDPGRGARRARHRGAHVRPTERRDTRSKRRSRRSSAEHCGAPQAPAAVTSRP